MSMFANVFKLVCKISMDNLKANDNLKAEMGDVEYSKIEEKISSECNKICQDFVPGPEIILNEKNIDDIYLNFLENLADKDHIELSKYILNSNNKTHFIEQISEKSDKLPISDSLMTKLYGEEETRFNQAFTTWINDIILSNPEIDIKPNDIQSINLYIDALMDSKSCQIYLLQRYSYYLHDQVSKKSRIMEEKGKKVIINAYNLLLNTSLEGIQKLLVVQLEQYFKSKLTYYELNNLENVLTGTKNSDINEYENLKSRISEIFNSFFDEERSEGPSFKDFRLESQLLISDGVIKFWQNVIRALSIKNVDVNFNKNAIYSELALRLIKSISASNSYCLKSYRKAFKNSFFKHFYEIDLSSPKTIFFDLICSQFKKPIKESAQTQLRNSIRDKIADCIDPESVKIFLSRLELDFKLALLENIPWEFDINAIIGNLQKKTYSNFKKELMIRLNDDSIKKAWSSNALTQALDNVTGTSNYFIKEFFAELKMHLFCNPYGGLLKHFYTASPNKTNFNNLLGTCLKYFGRTADEFNNFERLFSDEVKDITAVRDCFNPLKDDNYRGFKESLKVFLKSKFSENKQLQIFQKYSVDFTADLFDEAEFNKALKAYKSNSKDNEETYWWKWLLGGVLLILGACGSVYFLRKNKLADQ